MKYTIEYGLGRDIKHCVSYATLKEAVEAVKSKHDYAYYFVWDNSPSGNIAMAYSHDEPCGFVYEYIKQENLFDWLKSEYKIVAKGV